VSSSARDITVSACQATSMHCTASLVLIDLAFGGNLARLTWRTRMLRGNCCRGV